MRSWAPFLTPAMADDNYTSTSTAAASATASPSRTLPPSLGIRRAVTADEATHPRRRLPSNTSATAENPFAEARRRSSNFSDLSLNDAQQSVGNNDDGLWNPGAQRVQPGTVIPLALALMPALGGILFTNGSAFLTDVILLGLAAVFLHWSVTQPWNWYRAAQEIQLLKDEAMMESVFESDSEAEHSAPGSAAMATGHVPEEETKEEEGEEELTADEHASAQRPWERRRESAARELHIHEMLALTWCFLFPMLGAYLLHTIRGQLSRPSEGLVSDYNLCIFLIAAEVPPVAHILKLIQGRTLRLQRVVASNPHTVKSSRNQQFEALYARIDRLEVRAAAGEVSSAATQADACNAKVAEAMVARSVRDGIQPELDALNRAVRRYEKKIAILAGQTDNRLEYLEYRLNDAIALAAVAAKHSTTQQSMASWLFEKTTRIIVVPIQTAVAVFMFPFRTLSSLLGRQSRASAERSHRAGRYTRPGSSRANSDRVPARVSKR